MKNHVLIHHLDPPITGILKLLSESFFEKRKDSEISSTGMNHLKKDSIIGLIMNDVGELIFCFVLDKHPWFMMFFQSEPKYFKNEIGSAVYN